MWQRTIQMKVQLLIKVPASVKVPSTAASQRRHSHLSPFDKSWIWLVSQLCLNAIQKCLIIGLWRQVYICTLHPSFMMSDLIRVIHLISANVYKYFLNYAFELFYLRSFSSADNFQTPAGACVSEMSYLIVKSFQTWREAPTVFCNDSNAIFPPYFIGLWVLVYLLVITILIKIVGACRVHFWRIMSGVNKMLCPVINGITKYE